MKVQLLVSGAVNSSSLLLSFVKPPRQQVQVALSNISSINNKGSLLASKCHILLFHFLIVSEFRGYS